MSIPESMQRGRRDFTTPCDFQLLISTGNGRPFGAALAHITHNTTGTLRGAVTWDTNASTLYAQCHAGDAQIRCKIRLWLSSTCSFPFLSSVKTVIDCTVLSSCACQSLLRLPVSAFILWGKMKRSLPAITFFLFYSVLNT